MRRGKEGTWPLQRAARCDRYVASGPSHRGCRGQASGQSRLPSSRPLHPRLVLGPLRVRVLSAGAWPLASFPPLLEPVGSALEETRILSLVLPFQALSNPYSF